MIQNKRISLYLILIIFLLRITPLFSQTIQKQWDIRFGGRQSHGFSQSIINSDGSILLCGFTNSQVSGSVTIPPKGGGVDNYDAWIVKTDKNGAYQWQQRYGGASYESLHDAIACKNGDYLLVMSSYSGVGYDKSEGVRGGNDSGDVWLMRIDANGNKIWDKTLGGSNTDYAQTGVELDDGNFLILASTKSNAGYDVTDPHTNSYAVLWVIKVSPTGEKIWDKKIKSISFGTVGFNQKVKLVKASNTSFKLGNSGGSIGYSAVYCMSEIDTSGALLSSYNYRNDGDCTFSDMIKTSDGNYILLGTASPGTSADKTDPGFGFTAARQDYWAIKVTPNGQRIWDKAYGGNLHDEAGAIAETEDGGLLIVGGSQSGVSGNKKTPLLSPDYFDAWGVKTDKDGNYQYEFSYKGTLYEKFERIRYIDSASIYIGGTIGSNLSNDITAPPQSYSDYGIIKYAIKDTSSTPNSIVSSSKSTVFLYPNPVKEGLYLNSNNKIDNYQIMLTDIVGRVIDITTRVSQNNNGELKIDLNSFPNGVYFINGTLNEKEYFNARFVKVD